MTRLPQIPGAAASATESSWFEPLSEIGWFDWTAVVVLLVFVGLGLRRGSLWQLSRILTLLLAYATAVRFGPELAQVVRGWFASSESAVAPSASTARAPTTAGTLSLYLTTTALFLAVVVLVSCLALLLERLARQEQHSVSDRLLGAALGTLTGGLLVGALLGCLLMFTGSGTIGQEVRASQSMEYGRQVIGWLGARVPPAFRELFGTGPTDDPLSLPGPGRRPSPEHGR